MNWLMIINLVLLGMVAGYFSGLVGIGGGVIIVPALVLLFGFNQHNAQGTTLALLVPPIGILGALTYYQKGYVDVKSAAFICVGFLVGGYLGGKLAVALPDYILKRVFAVILIGLGVRMLLVKSTGTAL
jgi:uncharacterized membrane protein YfcA